jgi:hypothetical protein
MIWQNYQLDGTIFKIAEAITLWRTEKGPIELGKNTLVIPIKQDSRQKGYIFHGHGKLLLDTIVETREGAVGNPVECELNEFLMLGDTEEIRRRLSTATKDDVTRMGYESEQGFIDKAKDLFDQFFGNRGMHIHRCCGDNNGVIFAFPNETGKLDILIANGSKLVYKAINKVFVSNKDKVVLKTPNEVILSGDRQSFVIKK